MKARAESFQAIEGTRFEVCVIGGGVTGAGCAWDAQLRGLKTALVEAGDFASATSGASTKLAHGGVRYLQQAVAGLDLGQYHVVKRALDERRLMLHNAPHLAHPLEILVPCYSRWDIFYYWAGMKLYDAIAGKGNLSPSRYRSMAESIADMPMLSREGLVGTVAYSDGQFDDARFALALVESSVALGGEALNYARVVGLAKDAKGRLVEAEVEDVFTRRRFRLRARAFVNATGAFSDHIREMAKPGIPKRLRLSKGVHILLPLDPELTRDAMLIPNTDDGRVIFAIPWLGRLLVGTTDDEATLEDEVVVTYHEADYLLRHLNRYLGPRFGRDQIVSAFAGMRPLVAHKDARKTKKLIHDHEVEVEPESGLISVLGGKWTTYRAMAEDAVNSVVKLLGMPDRPCLTADHLLSGSEGFAADYWQTLVGKYALSSATAQHLAGKFGTNAPQVLEIVQRYPGLGSPIVEGLAPIRAEIVYNVHYEMAMTIEDILARRLRLQLLSWKSAIEAAPVVGSVMASLLGWGPIETQQAVEGYVQKISRLMRKIGLVQDRPMA